MNLRHSWAKGSGLKESLNITFGYGIFGLYDNCTPKGPLDGFLWILKLPLLGVASLWR